MRRQHALQVNRSLSRQRIILGLCCLGFAMLAINLITIQVYGHDKLIAEASDRHIRTIETKAIRGPIYDRNNRLLAVSTPVDSVWAQANIFCQTQSSWPKLFSLLKLSKSAALKACKQRAKRNYENNFLYIKRQVPPVLAEQVEALAIPGVHLQRNYKRFYPSGPATGHLVGFTDIDGNGLEGIEKAYNGILRGAHGKQTVHRDNKGRFIEFVEQIDAVKNGAPLALSIDSRLQYLISGYLEQTVRQHHARGGSAVLIHAKTGEIFAMVTSPQFNPNDRSSLSPERIRNRAVTDVQEPGSTVKPFTIATALETGDFTPLSTIDTGQIPFNIPGGSISDTHPHGMLTLEQIVVKSSNIGAAKLLMEIPYDKFYTTFDQLGFGHKVNALPAETSGVLPKRKKLIDRVTQAYGYGLNATPLQLARAYTVFANDGNLMPITIRRHSSATNAIGKRVFSRQTTRQMLRILEGVTSQEGTAKRVQIPRYRVGGKTGTSIRNTGNGYEKDHYVSWFVGLAPMSNPTFVLAVMIDDPRAGKYYGGTVAGPVFTKSMQDVLRLYNIAPDNIMPDNSVQNQADSIATDPLIAFGRKT